MASNVYQFPSLVNQNIEQNGGNMKKSKYINFQSQGIDNN